MAVYRLATPLPREAFSSLWKVPWFLASFIALWWVCIHFANDWDKWFPFFYIPALVVPFCAIGIFICLAIAVSFPWAIRRVGSISYDVSPEGVSHHRGSKLGDLFFPRDEIIGFVRKKNKGIVLLASGPARGLAGPFYLDGFQLFLSELAAIGIHEVSQKVERENRIRRLAPSFIFVLSVLGIPFGRNVVQVAVSGTVALAAQGWMFYNYRKLPDSFGAGFFRAKQFSFVAMLVGLRLFDLTYHPRPSVVVHTILPIIMLYVLADGAIWLWRHRSNRTSPSSKTFE